MVRGLVPECVAVLVALAGVSHGRFATADIKVGHWNVYWRALDDPRGQAAIREGVEQAAAAAPFDFFSVVEASGDTRELGSFPAWAGGSPALLGPGGRMGHLSGRSSLETIALFYSAEAWSPVWWKQDEFEPGRPYMVALFRPRGAATPAPAVPLGAPVPGPEDAGFACADAVWVTSAHLPHYARHSAPAGEVLAGALRDGSRVTGCDAVAIPSIIMGDFNEFGECAPMGPTGAEPRCHGNFPHAGEIMSPLWRYFGAGMMAEAADLNVITCCTKWHESGEDDWKHHYDHIYFSAGFFNVSAPPQLIPYAYPGTTGACTRPACDQAHAPNRVRPLWVGSWHRGLQVSLRPRRHPERAFIV